MVKKPNTNVMSPRIFQPKSKVLLCVLRGNLFHSETFISCKSTGKNWSHNILQLRHLWFIQEVCCYTYQRQYYIYYMIFSIHPHSWMPKWYLETGPNHFLTHSSSMVSYISSLWQVPDFGHSITAFLNCIS